MKALSISVVSLLVGAISLTPLVGCERWFATRETAALRVDASSATLPRSPDQPCPSEMALVTVVDGDAQAQAPQVCVDKYEAAIEGWPYSHALSDTDASATAAPPQSPLHAVPAKGIKPQVNISQTQAAEACAASSKRLCTAREWTAACRGGPKNLMYPYGNEHEAGACNEGRAGPQDNDVAKGKRHAESDNGIEPGGAFRKCVTELGVFDMHGNVHEWVSDDAKPGDKRFGMFLGGFFADATGNGAGCTYRTTAHFKEYYDYSTGFRCCKDALVSTSSL